MSQPSPTPRGTRKHTAEPPPEPPRPGRKLRTVRLPGFLVEEETGLGDLIKKATSSAGIKPCGGCAQRAAALNRRVVFIPGRKR